VIAFASALLRVVFVLLLVRLAGRFLVSLLRGGGQGRPAAPAKGGELVRDRVCNTFLPRERALAARIDGREEHFCSASCRDRALTAVSRAS
jgi:hypothetical protein